MRLKPKRQGKKMSNIKSVLIKAVYARPITLLGCICLLFAVLRLPSSAIHNLILLCVGLTLVAAVTIVLGIKGKLTLKTWACLFIAAGFLLRLYYILHTDVFERQHDVWSFSNGDFVAFDDCRHAEYIEYIATYLKLPNIYPANGLSQLYHPPFHHIIAGLWLRFNTVLGIDYTAATENIQLLTLFYSSACMLIVYRILKRLGCKAWGLLLPLVVVCFHPTFIIMAGSVNNDILSIALALYSIYAALRWYENPSVYNIVTVALGIGLSMMTKLSGGLVSIGIALIFLYKWIEGIRQKNGTAKKMFRQFALFGVICVPLALWWQAKNFLIYRVSPLFVPALSSESGQYLGDYSLLERLFSVKAESLEQIFICWEDKGTSFNEYNPILALLKTSVFGEHTLFGFSDSLINNIGNISCIVLFWVNALIIGLSLYAGVRCLIKYRKTPVAWCIFIIWLVIFGSYMQFCFKYPQVCTQNFRYAVPTLVCGLSALGVHMNEASLAFKRITAVAVTVFCIASAFTYALVGVV